MAGSRDMTLNVTVDVTGSGGNFQDAQVQAAADAERRVRATGRPVQYRATAPVYDSQGRATGSVQSVTERIASNDEIISRIGNVASRQISAGIPMSAAQMGSIANIHAHRRNSDFLLATRELAFLEEAMGDSIDRHRPIKAQQGVGAKMYTRAEQIRRHEDRLARNPNLPGAAAYAASIDAMRNAPLNDAQAWGGAMYGATGAWNEFKGQLAAATPASQGRINAANVTQRKIDDRIDAARLFNATGPIDPKTGLPVARSSPVIAGAIAQADALKAANAPLLASGSRADLAQAAANDVLRKEQADLIKRETKNINEKEGNTKKESKLLNWMESRGTRLSGAMAFRSGVGRMTQFGQGLMTAEGSEFQSTLGVGGVKAATGIGTDVMMNRFITKGGAGNLMGMVSFGVADAIVGAIQSSIQRGGALRKEATERANSQEASLSRVLGATGTWSSVNKKVTAGWSEDDKSAEGIAETLRAAAAAGTGDGAIIARAMLARNTSPTRQQASVQAQRSTLNAMRLRASYAASRDWNDSFDFDAAVGGMGSILEVGGDPRLMAKAGYGRRKRGRSPLDMFGLGGGPDGYDEGADELGLGARVAGIATNTRLKANSAAALMSLDQLGIGRNGIDGANRFGGLTLHGLPSTVANQIAGSIAASGATGMNIDAKGEAGYLNSLIGAGVAPGRLGTAWNAALGGRQQAKDTIGGGFKGMLGNGALIEALSKTNDLGEAMDMVSNMSMYDQVQATKRHFGDYIASKSLQAEGGMSSSDAAKYLAAGPEGLASSYEISTGSDSPHNKTKNENNRLRWLMGEENSVVTEDRNAAIQQSLNEAAVLLHKAASAIGGMAMSPF